VRERENLNQENGRGRRRVREKEILKNKIGRGSGTVKVKENFFKRKTREGEEDWERGRIWKPKTKWKWMRERARSKIDSKEL
jgi:hypothetical protein